MVKKEVFKNNPFLIAFIVFSILAITLFSVFASTNSIPSSQNIPSGNIKNHFQWCVSHIDGKTGIRTDYPCEHNLVVNSGLNAIRDTLRGASSFGSFIYIALGNSSNASSAAAPVATDTILSGEYTTNGLNRAAGSSAILGTGNWSVWYSFTSTGVTLSTNKTCLFNQSTGGTMFSCVNFPETQLQGAYADVILVNGTYYVTSG